MRKEQSFALVRSCAGGRIRVGSSTSRRVTFHEPLPDRRGSGGAADVAGKPDGRGAGVVAEGLGDRGGEGTPAAAPGEAETEQRQPVLPPAALTPAARGRGTT